MAQRSCGAVLILCVLRAHRNFFSPPGEGLEFSAALSGAQCALGASARAMVCRGMCVKGSSKFLRPSRGGPRNFCGPSGGAVCVWRWRLRDGVPRCGALRVPRNFFGPPGEGPEISAALPGEQCVLGASARVVLAEMCAVRRHPSSDCFMYAFWANS